LLPDPHARFTTAAGALLLALAFQLPILRILEEPRTHHIPVKEALTGLKRFFQTHTSMSSALILDFGVVLFGSATAIVPFLNSTENMPAAVGFLRAAPSIGVIIATLIALALPGIRNWQRGLFIATFGFGICHLVLAVSSHWLFSAVLLIGSGIFDGISLSIREVILQIDTPGPLKGRVYSINSFLVNASDDLGEWESGVAARHLGLRQAIALGATLTLGLSLSFARWSSRLNKNRSQSQWDRPRTSSPLQVSN
jgi:hypothetical protein